jgi:hypothetical protein
VTNYIKITPTHTGDSRWLHAGANAFAVHMWALDYSNRMELDGRIARAMAERLALPVPPSEAAAAIEALVRLGFWRDEGDDLVIDRYDTYALSSQEIRATRDRWANDQRRRRKHGNGVHDECDPSRCNFLMSHADTRGDSVPDSRRESSTKTRPDKTRPDQTFRSGSGTGTADAAPADAGRHSGTSLAPHRFVAPIDNPEYCDYCGLTRNEPHMEESA